MQQALFERGGDHQAAGDAGDDQSQGHAAEAVGDVQRRVRRVSGLQCGNEVAAVLDQPPHEPQQAPTLDIPSDGLRGVWGGGPI